MTSCSRCSLLSARWYVVLHRHHSDWPTWLEVVPKCHWRNIAPHIRVVHQHKYGFDMMLDIFFEIGVMLIFDISGYHDYFIFLVGLKQQNKPWWAESSLSSSSGSSVAINPHTAGKKRRYTTQTAFRFWKISTYQGFSPDMTLYYQLDIINWLRRGQKMVLHGANASFVAGNINFITDFHLVWYVMIIWYIYQLISIVLMW